MWIVRLALRRPYTFVVAALVVMILTAVIVIQMPKDIFPVINTPVVAVIWSYQGMSPDDVEGRIVTITERALTTTVNDLEHIESQSLVGLGVVKVYFQPGVNIASAVAQTSATMETVLRVMPPGITPPFIIQYSAASVPVIQIAVTSDKLTEEQLYDYDLNFVRRGFATVKGAAVPLPYGGRQKQIMVDLDPQAMLSKGVQPSDVSNAINAQNLILPAGTVKIGDIEYNVRLNSSPTLADSLNDLPIKNVGDATVYVRDVAQVRNGGAVQTNIVRVDGRRATLLTILKTGSASTLDVVNALKARLPAVQATVPPEMKMKFLFDQSIFVKSSLYGVLKEGAIAAGLTALMILLFLGSWRSTLIVATSIPLSICCSIIVMYLLGETLNIMTLGGLALAVGILVDDTTVEIENIHRNLGMKKEINKAILDGASQIAVPAFVSTLAICIVFAPVVFLQGTAKYLFTPLAGAVVFAMLASYLISRTIVPTMVKYLLRGEVKLYQEPEKAEKDPTTRRSPIWRVHFWFEHHFDKFRDGYKGMLNRALHHPALTLILLGTVAVLSLSVFFFIGEDFFPEVDAGQFRLHVRAAPGTRIEQTEALYNDVEASLRKIIPSDQLDTIVDNIGLPVGGINMAYSTSATISSADGEILVNLKEGHKTSTFAMEKEIREKLPKQFTAAEFSFAPPDIVSQILNFGLPAPIDVQVQGASKDNFELAQKIQKDMAAIPGAADVYVNEQTTAPELHINVDRTKAQEFNLTQRDVASDVLISLSGSFQTAPNYWLDPKNGVNYQITTQTPQYKVSTIDEMKRTPVGLGQTSQLLNNVSDVTRGVGPVNINHYDIQRTYDVYASTQEQDLASVAKAVDKIVATYKGKLPRGTEIHVRGQVESMRSGFNGLAGGLIFAIALVYFLMVVNFQSWTDPAVILMALPGALAGILWMLFATQTTINVPSLMGAIMSIGVATSNSILMVTFANDRREEGADAITAALDAGFTRLRPVLMTALAMILGMLPMAMGFGEGGEQNAPLGRAVIGGLTFATFYTLFFVPVVYSLLRKKQPVPAEELPE